MNDINTCLRDNVEVPIYNAFTTAFNALPRESAMFWLSVAEDEALDRFKKSVDEGNVCYTYSGSRLEIIAKDIAVTFIKKVRRNTPIIQDWC